MSFRKGFTLTELLISLAILGEIATFTIPKILTAQQDTSFNASAKETMAMVAGAYQVYKFNTTASSSMTMGDLTPYMNYVAVDSASTIDQHYTSSTFTCGSGNNRCLSLHNGGKLFYVSTCTLGGTGSTNTLQFWYDPDGRVTTGTTNGPGKALAMTLFYTGRIVNYGSAGSNCSCYGCGVNSSSVDPPWFSW